jgi:hypothetical protein
MLAVTQFTGAVAASGTKVITIGPIVSGTRNLLMHMSVGYAAASTNGATMSFATSPVAANGTAAGYVASAVKSVTVKPVAAGGFGDVETLLSLGDDPYKLDSNIGFVQITVTNNDGANPLSLWVGTEDQRNQGR